MHQTSASCWPSKKSFAEPEPRHIRRGLKRLEPATKRTRENVFASLNLRDRSCYATFSREDRRTCSKGRFYTYRRPDASGWVLRGAGLKGSGHGGSDARASNAPGAYSFQSRSSVSCRLVAQPSSGWSETRPKLECRGAALSGLRVIRPQQHG